MSDTSTRPGSGDWQDVGLPRNLLAFGPDVPWYQKALDIGSVPARIATNMLLGPVLGGGQAFQRWMAGDQGPETRRLLTSSALGLATPGLGLETPGPASFGAWHGSRHLFEPEPGAPAGQFKAESVGTGEGAQAYGWGHYVAGNRGVAEQYRTAGSDEFSPRVMLDKKPVELNKHAGSEDGSYLGLVYYSDSGGNHETAVLDLQREARDLFKRATSPGDPFGPSAVPHTSEELAEFRRLDLVDAKALMQGSRWLEDNHQRLEYQPAPEGHLYQVHVSPDEHQLLDWDRPMHRQELEVQDKIKDLVHPSLYRGSMSGEDLYGMLATRLGSQREASAALHDAGIPGLMYRDQGSRHLPVDHPDATRNYVLFHPRHLRIVGRDGQNYGLEAVEHDPFGEPGR